MMVRFETALICEDIRREERGMLAVAGVFAADLIVDRFPAVLSLSFLLVADVREVIEREVDIRLQLDDRSLFQGKGKMAPQCTGRALFPIPRQVVKVENPGMLRLAIRQANASWQILASTPVRSNEAEQPLSISIQKPRLPGSGGQKARKPRLH